MSNWTTEDTVSPVVGQQAVTEDEPAPLVALQVVGPFKEPAFVGVRTRQVEPREGRGGQTLDQLVHRHSGRDGRRRTVQ